MNIAYIFSEGETATTDYFVLPHLESHGYGASVINTALSPYGIKALPCPAVAVISRYLPHRWRNLIESYASRGVRLVYFMDDDLFDIQALRGLPWRYRWKILRLAISQKNRLIGLCDEFWVSTTHLASKYADLNPQLIQPAPMPALIEPAPPLIHVCYHGTASHKAERGWLVDVVRNVQSRMSTTHFELFGDADVRRYYRDIPRVSIMHEMKWPQYRSWSSVMQRDIALAPLLPSPFNTGRGPTKFFDYTRLGAAGIYTDMSPYRGFIRDGVDGVLVGNDPEQWAEAIIRLATDSAMRQSIATLARCRALSIAGHGGDIAQLKTLPAA